MVLGKPGLWPALVLNTVLRKPCGQLPLAGVREPEVSDVPEVEPPELPEPLEDPDEPEAALLGPALLARVLDGGADSCEDGETRFSPALAWRPSFRFPSRWGAIFVPDAEDRVQFAVEFPEFNLHGDALLPAARKKARLKIDSIISKTR